jgi:two-component system, NtrC family, response regulator HydG
MRCFSTANSVLLAKPQDKHMSQGRLLLVDDERVALRNLEHIMKKQGYHTQATQSGANALAALEKEEFDVVLTDLRMEKVDGMQVLQRCREISPDTEVIIITAFASLESAVALMKQGAFYYIAKPFRLDEVRQVVSEALAKVRLKRENRALREEVEKYQGKVRIITQHPEMQHLLETARQVAPTDCTVLLSGESGTGKELFAKYLHYHSHRREQAYLAVNCGAFSEELLANELFGHEKGAFTGAHSAKAGLLETVSGGTLFLDEITEMPLSMQVKLLRVVQEREVLRLGGTRPQKVDVRFIAATNRDIRQAVQEGLFRQDLYFRLNVVNLHIPPLAQRRGDVPLLARYFLHKHAALMRKDLSEISAQALEALQAYDFPGNVRELENIIERGVALSTEDTLGIAQLSDDLRESGLRTFRKQDGRIPTLEEVENDYIRWVLQEARGNQSQAAQLMGMDRVSLWRRLKKIADAPKS